MYFIFTPPAVLTELNGKPVRKSAGGCSDSDSRDDRNSSMKLDRSIAVCVIISALSLMGPSVVVADESLPKCRPELSNESMIDLVSYLGLQARTTRRASHRLNWWYAPQLIGDGVFSTLVRSDTTVTTPTTVLTSDGYALFDGPLGSGPPYAGPTVLFYHLPFDPRSASTSDVSAAIDFVGTPTAALIDPINYLGPGNGSNIEEEALFSSLTVLPPGQSQYTGLSMVTVYIVFPHSMSWSRHHPAHTKSTRPAIPCRILF